MLLLNLFLITSESVFDLQIKLIEELPTSYTSYHKIASFDCFGHLTLDEESILLFDHAAREGFIRIVEWFLSKSLSNIDLFMAIKSACKGGQLSILQLLISRLDCSLPSTSTIPLSTSNPPSSISPACIGQSFLEATMEAAGNQLICNYFCKSISLNQFHFAIVEYMLPILITLGVDINLGYVYKDEFRYDSRTISESLLFTVVCSLISFDSVEGWRILRWLVAHKEIDINKNYLEESHSDQPPSSTCLFVYIVNSWNNCYYRVEFSEYFATLLAHTIKVIEYLVNSGYNSVKDSLQVICILTKSELHSTIHSDHALELLKYFSINHGFELQNIGNLENRVDKNDIELVQKEQGVYE